MFSGRRTEMSVDTWLFQMRQYFDNCKAEDNQKVPYASSLLKDDAIIWWRNHLESAENNHEEGIKHWDDFKKAITEQFKYVNARKIARDKLAVIQQKKSVQEYATEYRSLLLEIPGMLEEEKVDRFIRGLKDYTRLETELRDPDSLSDAIKIAERHDSITLPYQKKVIDPIKKAQTTVQDFGSTPIEIDSKKKPAWRNPICYLCDEAGHVVKNCPLKKQLKKSLSSVNKKVVTRYHQQNKAIPQDKNINIKPDTDNNELLNIYEDKPSKLFVLKGVISQVPA